MDQPNANSDPVITDISGEGEPEVTEIESLCIQCEEQDLSRHVVLSNTATVSIPEVELEIPPSKGSLTTIEGILEKVILGLEQDQDIRKVQHPDEAEKIEEFIQKLKRLKNFYDCFTLKIDDISGNSFVENPHAPSDDPQMTVSRYTRTSEQDARLGIEPTTVTPEDTDDASLRNEVMQLDTNCPSCGRPCPLKMKVVAIPHFKDVVIMATTCEACGYRSNEVKGGGGISEQGRRITLTIQGPGDLKRDLLKGETSLVRIPELEFEAGIGSLGGKFTTVEGLLTDIKNSLCKMHPFVYGDSSEADRRTRVEAFCTKLAQIINGTLVGVHLVLDDVAGNSFIENPLAPADDPQLEIVDYERTYDQNEELGLNDMNTETYERL